MSDASPPARRRSRLAALAALVAGACPFGTGAVLLTLEPTREPTAAELAGAKERERHERRRLWTADELFPPEVSYGGGAQGGGAQTARRVGVAPEADCKEGLDGGALKAVAGRGCETVLRAGYVDASGTEVTTVGVLPLRDADAAREAADALDGKGGVRAAAFPRTAAAVTDAARHPKGGYTTTVGHGPIDPAAALAVAPDQALPEPSASGGTATFGTPPVPITAVRHARAALLPPAALLGRGAGVLVAAFLLRRRASRPSPPAPVADAVPADGAAA
ncbi:hypothetical protein EDD29_3902 [Actinocorallia herbida]|uniref:Uncharacterized protein n=1 Tax=Actinocorallia herbida TaxID=58109 RepID=A0A3N1CZX5_9ACTN|nr:hypothetical protein [Actinocorallia herbida]ROO86338.1 hypothetical protein EDD29_3902 [Actinocorallia herbida]